MPIRPADLRLRGIAPTRPTREEPDMPFDELLFTLAEGIASAQSKLDLTTAEVLETLAETEVEVVPHITRSLQADGAIDVETAEAETRSLLELGFTPTRYQFSEANIDIGVDISITEQEERDSETEGRTYGLRAGTYEIREERKYDREVKANASISARLEPVPLPVELHPTESREEPEES